MSDKKIENLELLFKLEQGLWSVVSSTDTLACDVGGAQLFTIEDLSKEPSNTFGGMSMGMLLQVQQLIRTPLENKVYGACQVCDHQYGGETWRWESFDTQEGFDDWGVELDREEKEWNDEHADGLSPERIYYIFNYSVADFVESDVEGDEFVGAQVQSELSEQIKTYKVMKQLVEDWCIR